MRNKKNRGFSDDMKIDTVSTLLQRINAELDKRQEEVKIQDQANRELLTKTEKEERELIAEIGEAKEIVSKMMVDFSQIEVDVESAARKGIEEKVVCEADVKSGKVSLVQFRKEGKYDAKIAEEVLAKSVSELEISLSVVRAKNLEILRLQERLGDCRNTIRGLSIRPGITMRDLFKSLYEFSDVEVAEFSNELESLRTEWHQVKENIQLAEGKSISGRHVFERLTMSEAKNLQFSPCMPMSCISKLKKLLMKYEGSEDISITLYVNSKDIEITSIKPGRLVQITQLKEDPRAEFKRIK